LRSRSFSWPSGAFVSWKEPLARAVAEAAYRRGALFVDVSVFDVYFKRASPERAVRIA
jgi:hypothetical protein